MDGSAIAYLGMLTATTGEWDRGCAMVDAAMKLNPNYPGWFQIAIWANAYRKGQVRGSARGDHSREPPWIFPRAGGSRCNPGQAWLKRRSAEGNFRICWRCVPISLSVARQEYAKAVFSPPPPPRRPAQSWNGVSGESETSCHRRLSCRVTDPSEGRGTAHCKSQLPAKSACGKYPP